MNPKSNIASQKVTIDQLLFKHLYYRYNQFVAPVATILVCVLLFFFVVVPQMQSWFSLRDTLATNAQSLQVMHQNLATITALDNTKLDTALSIATRALPAEKDFTGIITSLQQAAAQAGTSLGDYSFGVGNISGAAAPGATQLPVQLNVSFRGDVTTAQYFIAAIQRQLPLADVLSVEVNGGTSVTVTVVFYYATLPQIAFQDDQPLPVLSSSAQSLLNTLAANSQQTFSIPAPQATPSATLTPIPTTTPPLPTVAPTITPAATSSATATSSAK